MIDRRLPLAGCFFFAALLAGCAASPADATASPSDGQALDEGNTPADWIVCSGAALNVYLWRAEGEIFTMRVLRGSERHDSQVHRYARMIGVDFDDVVGSELAIVTAGSTTSPTDNPWTSAPFDAILHFTLDTETPAVPYALQCRGPGIFVSPPRPQG